MEWRTHTRSAKCIAAKRSPSSVLIPWWSKRMRKKGNEKSTCSGEHPFTMHADSSPRLWWCVCAHVSVYMHVCDLILLYFFGLDSNVLKLTHCRCNRFVKPNVFRMVHTPTSSKNMCSRSFFFPWYYILSRLNQLFSAVNFWIYFFSFRFSFALYLRLWFRFSCAGLSWFSFIAFTWRLQWMYL